MTRFKFSRVALAALGLIALSSARADITIGVSLPLTGPASSLGIPVKNQLALFPTSIGGEKITMIVLDDATDPTKSVMNAKRFVSEDKVDIIFGSAATPVAAAMASVAAEAGTVQLSLSPTVLPPGKDAWHFRMAQANAVMAHPIVEHMKKSGIKTVGFLGYADAFGESWLQEFTPLAKKAGIEVVAVERFARADTSVTGQALKLVAAKPDAVLIVASGSGAAMPNKGLAERGYKGKVYQTHAAATRDLMRVGGKDVEGVYVVSGPAVVAEQLPDANPSKKLATDFVQKYEKAYGPGSRNQFAAHAYDTQIAMEKIVPMALKKAKPGTPEFRTALRDALQTMGRTPFSQGVVNWTAADHWGFTDETGVMLRVVDGDWKLD